MTKRDLLEVRQRACRDRGLSHGAARLFCVLVDTHYGGLVYPEEDEWEAAGPTVETWLHCGRNQAHGYRAELLKAGYIRYRRLRGIPPTHVFSFVQCPRKGAIDLPEKGRSIAPKQGNQSPRKGEPLTKKVPTGLRVDQKGGGESAPKPAAPPAKKAPSPWWSTLPQFEELDGKTYLRERKALSKDMLEWCATRQDRLKVEFAGVGEGVNGWPPAARANWEALKARKIAIGRWVSGVRSA